jgi:adenylate kinase
MQLEDLDATRQKLCSEVCRYRGYVLDAQVAGFDEVEQLFCTDFELPLDEEEEEAIAAAAKEAEENGEEPPVVQPKTERRLSEAGIVPSFVVLLQAPEALCRARSKASGPISEKKFEKEMELYAQRNLVDGEMNFSDFFQDFAKIGAFNLPIAGKFEEDLFESTRIYMESGQGRPFNYLKSTDEVAQELLEKKSEKEQAEQFKVQEMKRQVSAGSRDADAAVCRRRDERLRNISAHEEQRKQIEALPLRNYLMRYMVPNLTEGLIEMCRVMPENPTDYLANYLEEHAAHNQTEN